MNNSPKRKALPGVFWAATLTSLSIILTTVFKWPLMEQFTPFSMIWLLLGLGLVFLAVVIWSLVHMLRDRDKTWRGAIALFICIVTFFLMMIPFDWLWIQYNFHVNKTARKDIVRKVLDGTLEPKDNDSHGHIAIGEDAPVVSMGGNVIMVEDHDGEKYVFFYTFRGVLDNYSGFLYVPAGGDPTLFYDLGEARSTQLVEFDENWYFVTHR